MPDWTDRMKGFKSLDMYKRSFWGVLPQIWSTLPQELVREGIEKGWSRIKSRCTKYIIHGALPEPKTSPKPKLKSKEKSLHAFIPENYSTKLNNELSANAQVFTPTNKQSVKSKAIPI